jgi:hypothetical protein
MLITMWSPPSAFLHGMGGSEDSKSTIELAPCPITLHRGILVHHLRDV